MIGRQSEFQASLGNIERPCFKRNSQPASIINKMRAGTRIRAECLPSMLKDLGSMSVVCLICKVLGSIPTPTGRKERKGKEGRKEKRKKGKRNGDGDVGKKGPKLECVTVLCLSVLLSDTSGWTHAPQGQAHSRYKLTLLSTLVS